ncbi:MAG: hypothetical protein AAB074_13765 [Planctomycetota bacterium]
MTTPPVRCESCGQNQGTVRVAHIEYEKVEHERLLCHDCAVKEGVLGRARSRTFEELAGTLKDIEKLLAFMKRNHASELRIVADARPSFQVNGSWVSVGNRPLSDGEIRRMFAEVKAADPFVAGTDVSVSCTVPSYGTFLVRASLVDGKPGFSAVPQP